MTLHSNYSHLLNSNEALDAATLVTLSKSRDAVRAEIRRLQEEEQVYTALLAPQRRLPAEILGEIFLLAIPGILDKSGREAVVKLCLVSKNWHNAALCTYRLWNRVSISPAVPLESYPKIVDWFSRSGDAPKALEYDTWSHSCIRFCSATNPLLRKLLLGGPLLKHLKLKLVQIRCFRTFLFSIALKADATWKRHVWDSLASFHLNFMDYPQLPPGVTLIVDDVHATHGHWIETRESTESLFQHIPFKANIFHLDLPAIDSAFLNPEFSRHAKLHIPPDILGCFTTFSIRCDWDGDHLVNMLKHCTHVQTLNLDFNSRGIYTKRERERAPGAVTLPRVRQLRFRNAANIMFLLGIKTPALQELDLGWSGDPATGDLFCQFLRKYLVESGNAGNLRSLRIANLRLSTTDLSPLFAPLRHLEHLTLDKIAGFDFRPTWGNLRDAARDSPLFEGLSAVNAMEYCWLPSLERLELLQLPSDCSLEGAIAYLEARKGSPSCWLVASYENAQNGIPDLERAYDLHRLRQSGIFLKILPLCQEVLDDRTSTS